MTNDTVTCRPGCGACCIAPSISSPILDMPSGKLAGQPCIHLDETMCCQLFTSPLRPAVCRNLQPERQMCGENRQQALDYLNELEIATKPA